MKDLPASVRPILRRLTRRVAFGLFLEIWPRWAIGSFLIAGTVALVCRMFFEGAAPLLRGCGSLLLLVELPGDFSLHAARVSSFGNRGPGGLAERRPRHCC